MVVFLRKLEAILLHGYAGCAWGNISRKDRPCYNFVALPQALNVPSRLPRESCARKVKSVGLSFCRAASAPVCQPVSRAAGERAGPCRASHWLAVRAGTPGCRAQPGACLPLSGWVGTRGRGRGTLIPQLCKLLSAFLQNSQQLCIAPSAVLLLQLRAALPFCFPQHSEADVKISHVYWEITACGADVS